MSTVSAASKEVLSPKAHQQIDEVPEQTTVEGSTASQNRGAPVEAPLAPFSQGETQASSGESRAVGMLAQLAQLNSDPKPAPIPDTPTVQIRERKHGKLVADPHRWLEMPFSQEQRVLPHQEHKIQEWVDAQNARTEQYVGQRKDIQTYLQQRYYEMDDRPMQRGARPVPNLGTIQWRREGAADSWKMYVRYESSEQQKPAVEDIPGQQELFPDFNPGPEKIQGEVLLDEAAMAEKLGLAPSSFVDNYSFSPDAKYLALAYGEYHGDDRRKIAIIDVATGEPVEGSGVLTHVKWSGLTWLDGKRLIYGKVQMSDDELAKNAPDEFHQQMLHTVGKPQDEDVGLFPEAVEPWVHSSVWKQGNRIYRSRNFVGTERSILESAEFDPDAIVAGESKFYPVYDHEGIEANMGFIPGTDRYLVRTKQQEDGTITTGRLAYVDANDPERKFHTLIPPVPGREMEGATFAGDKIVVDFQVNLGRRLAVYDKKGNLEREIDFEEAGLPAGATHGMHYDHDKRKLIVNYSSTLMPTEPYEVDLETGEMTSIQPSEFPFDPSKFTVEEISYTSKDGTEVPMQVIRAKEGYEKNGENPTLVYGYGGFEADIADKSFLMSSLIPFLEAGGTIALPALRGGAELGDAWHEEGMREKKQNVFDDYYGAAEALIERGYTSPEKLAAMGASNGGLLTGAAIVQKGKALYKVVAPHAGVLDMYRYHEFSSGRWWVNEYGDPEDAEAFEVLEQYSPYHNVTDGDYPMVIVTTGMFDSRVDPSHSLKFLAALQAHQLGDEPILGFFNPDSGHWPNRHPQRKSEFLALRMGAIMQGLGMDPPSENEDQEPAAA